MVCSASQVMFRDDYIIEDGMDSSTHWWNKKCMWNFD